MHNSKKHWAKHYIKEVEGLEDICLYEMATHGGRWLNPFQRWRIPLKSLV